MDRVLQWITKRMTPIASLSLYPYKLCILILSTIWVSFKITETPIGCQLYAIWELLNPPSIYNVGVRFVVIRAFSQEFLFHQKARQLINIDLFFLLFCIGLLRATVCIFWINLGFNQLWNESLEEIMKGLHMKIFLRMYMRYFWKVDGGRVFQKLFLLKCW